MLAPTATIHSIVITRLGPYRLAIYNAAAIARARPISPPNEPEGVVAAPWKVDIGVCAVVGVAGPTGVTVWLPGITTTEVTNPGPPDETAVPDGATPPPMTTVELDMYVIVEMGMVVIIVCAGQLEMDDAQAVTVTASVENTVADTGIGVTMVVAWAAAEDSADMTIGPEPATEVRPVRAEAMALAPTEEASDVDIAEAADVGVRDDEALLLETTEPAAGQVRLYKGVVVRVEPTSPKLGLGVVGAES